MKLSPESDTASPDDRAKDGSAGRKVHLVGAGGSGMRAMAEFLIDAGWTVTGSDVKAIEPSVRDRSGRRLRFHCGHHHGHVPADADLVVHTRATADGNPELVAARERRIPCVNYAAMLGRLMACAEGVAVAGTHGKSTTAAMIASVLEHAGVGPSVIVGAETIDRHRSGWSGAGKLFVVEACEYRRSFLEMAPRHAVVTGVEHDHIDCFTTESGYMSAFAEFIDRLADDGILLTRGDCGATQLALGTAASRSDSFGLGPHCRWRARTIRTIPNGTAFELVRDGQTFGQFEIRLDGIHNVLNAVAAIAFTALIGVATRQIRRAMEEFRGIRRRCELAGCWNEITLIDDYAHHPTAVRTTLESIRGRYSGRRLWCVFEPHQASRLAAFTDQFADALSIADRVSVAPVFMAREQVDNGQAETLVNALSSRLADAGCEVQADPSLDHIVATLDHEARPRDVVVTMGAGDIDRVRYEFTRRLQRNHAAR